jgi:hypothetical protein
MRLKNMLINSRRFTVINETKPPLNMTFRVFKAQTVEAAMAKLLTHYARRRKVMG